MLNTYFSDKKYEIKMVYVDSVGYRLTDGAKCLRTHLNLDDNETCCDCYCIVQIDGKTKGILMEDKDIETHRSREVNDGKRQMEYIYSKIKENKGDLPSLAFLCNAKFEYPLTAKTLSGRRTKVLFNNISGAPVRLRNTEIEIFVV